MWRALRVLAPPFLGFNPAKRAAKPALSGFAASCAAFAAARRSSCCCSIDMAGGFSANAFALAAAASATDSVLPALGAVGPPVGSLLLDAPDGFKRLKPADNILAVGPVIGFAGIGSGSAAAVFLSVPKPAAKFPAPNDSPPAGLIPGAGGGGGGGGGGPDALRCSFAAAATLAVACRVRGIAGPNAVRFSF